MTENFLTRRGFIYNLVNMDEISERQIIVSIFLIGLLIGLIIGLHTGNQATNTEKDSPSDEETLPEPYPTLEDNHSCPEKTSCPSQTLTDRSELPEINSETTEVIA